jgi:hypothetical protein
MRHAAALTAHWAMRAAAVACVLLLLRLFPGILTCARFSGKATSANRPLAARSLTSQVEAKSPQTPLCPALRLEEDPV